MQSYKIIRQPTILDVIAALTSESGAIELGLALSQEESERVVTIKSVTVHREVGRIDFTGTCPRQIGEGTQYWSVYVKQFSEDPTTASYEEDFFFL